MPTDPVSGNRNQKWWGRGLLVMALFALAFQGRTLYVFPVPDSLNYWYGDESWVMSEERTQMETGISHHPYALGATINQQIGLVLGSTWLSSALYGTPALIFQHSYPMIYVGRTVTFLLTCFSVLLLYFCLLKFGAGEVWAGFGALVLSTCSAFTIASHSARADMLIALAVFSACSYLAMRIADKRLFRSIREAFLFALLMTILSLVIWPHLITLLLPVSAYSLVRLADEEKLKKFAAAAGGAALALMLIFGSYYLVTGDFTTYGTHSQHTQFAEVSAQKPIAHLFSRSVQWNNLRQRVTMMFAYAPFFVLLILAAIGKTLIDLARRRTGYLKEARVREMLIVTALVLLSWLLFQGNAPYYLIHVLLLLTASLAFLSSKAFESLSQHVAARVCIVAVGAVLLFVHVQSLNSIAATSRLFSTESHRAIKKIEHSEIQDAVSRGIKQPLLLAELPCAFGLEMNPANRLMYTSFTSFPLRDEDAGTTLKRFGVNYAMLYVTAHDSSSIAVLPTINRYVESHGTLIDTATGFMFDMGRSYSHPDLSSPDTIKLYRLNEE